MSELTQEQRVRLAEIAGYKLSDCGTAIMTKHCFHPLTKESYWYKSGGVPMWQPDKDIAQAMEVFTTFSFFDLAKQSSISKHWFIAGVEGFYTEAKTPSMAICLAVLKADKESS